MPSVLYKILAQTHADYTPALWQELDDLYRGGYAIQAHAKSYLPLLMNEAGPRHDERIRSSGYVNHLGRIIDAFASALFSRELSVKLPADASDPSTPGVAPTLPALYAAFTKNADLSSTTFVDVEKAIFRTAILKKRAILAIDFPSAEEIAALNIVNAAGEEAAGIRPYAFEVQPEELINWKRKPRGAGFAWAVLYRRRRDQDSPTALPSGIIHEWKVWTLNDAGYAHWDLYKSPEPENGQFDQDFPIPWDSGDDTSFIDIPLIEFDLPEGLWVGNKIGLLCKEHYQRRSALVAAENKSLVAIPVLKRGPELEAGGAIPSDIQQNPNRGARPVAQFNSVGWLEIGSGDDLVFAEPEGKAYALVDSQLKDLKDEIYRIVDQLAASADNSSSSMRRSGESKKQDRSSESIVLGEFGARVRAHAVKVFTAISSARNENVVWVPYGLDDYDQESRADILQEAINASNVSIPSATFSKMYKTKLATALVRMPPETQDVVRQEIEDGVDDELAQKKALQDAVAEAAQNPPTTGENDLPNKGAPSAQAGASKSKGGKPAPKGAK